MLRFVRFITRLDFQADDDSFAAVRNNAEKIKEVSKERTFDELTKILIGPNVVKGFRILKETRLLKHILPQVDQLSQVEQPVEHHPEGDVWEHTLKALSMTPERSEVVMWSILLHDVGKLTTGKNEDGKITFHGHDKAGVEIARDILNGLKVSSEFKDKVLKLIGSHMWITEIHNMKKSTLKRAFNCDNGEFLRQLRSVHIADALASNCDLSCVNKLDEFLTLQEQEISAKIPQVFVTGKDLIERGFVPGKGFGDILRKINDLFLDQEVKDISEVDFELFK